MHKVSKALRAVRRALRPRDKGRRPVRRTLGRAEFATPFLELLEDRTLPSANPAQLGGIVDPQTGIVGDAAGIALVPAARLPDATSSPFTYLGYPAQVTAANQLTVFASGDIDVSSFRPDSLRAQGIRSLVVQGSDSTDDTLRIDLSHGDIPLDVTFHGGAG